MRVGVPKATERLPAIGIFSAGLISGGLIIAAALCTDSIEVEAKLSLSDLLQILIALFLALYIPFAIESSRDRHRYSRDILVDQVHGFLALLREINSVLLECAKEDVTQESDRIRVRAAFITANLKVQAIEQRVQQDCKESNDILSGLRSSYKEYYDAVTGGALYGSEGKADWSLWRKQELPFIALENVCVDLVRFLRDV